MFIRKNINVVNNFDSKPQPVKLKGYPPGMEECFQLLRAANVQHFALFGGSVRDADYSARYNKRRRINDYDIRVWLPTADYEQHLKAFIEILTSVSNEKIEEVRGRGIRHCLTYKGIELDISVRPIPIAFKNVVVPVEAVAIDQASGSDIGLCSVAIDSTGCAWAKPEYMLDQIMKTLTVYPNYPNTNSECKIAYAKRMKEKFPDHVIAWTDELDISLLSVNRLPFSYHP